MIARRLTTILAGLLSGLVAGLALTLVQLLMRRELGISPPQEMIPDRFAPTLDVDRFIDLVNEYGYNDLKRFGIQAGLAGVLATSAIIGVIYALLAASPPRRLAFPPRSSSPSLRLSIRPSLGYLSAAFAALYLGSLAVLWPNLDTNTKGLPPSHARLATAAGYLAAYLLYALVLLLTHALITRRADFAEARRREGRAVEEVVLTSRLLASSPPRLSSSSVLLPRRAVVAGLAAATLAYPSIRLLRDFEDDATFSYDGRRYSGPGIQPVTPNDKFYTVTKNTVDPDVDRGWWRLEVNGHVDNPRTYDYEELVALPTTTQLTTLMCISNHVSAGLISNAEWVGVPMKTLLEAAGVKDGALEVLLRGADGYTDTFAIEKALDPTTLVVYQMNGEPLPRIHGYPVRVIVPGLFGEKNVKWVTGIEVVTRDAKGFYEQQGWGPNFEIPTRSDFFSPQLAGGNGRFRDPFAVNKPVTLRGRAFGGARGISRIEISFDDAQTWQEITQIDYAGTDLTWKFWSYRWTPRQPGDFVLAVRAYDGAGQLQPLAPLPSDPREGSNGIHRVRAKVQ